MLLLPFAAHAAPPWSNDDIQGAPYVSRWSGMYLGFHAGYLSGRAGFDLAGYPDASWAGYFPSIPPHTRAHSASFEGGGQYGYNYQLGSLVLGFEHDLMLTPEVGAGTRRATVITSGTIPGVGRFDLGQQQELQWLSTMRGRIGWAAGDRLLIYGTGGLAFGGVKTTTALGSGYYNAQSDYRVGWSAGAGIEYAMTENLSLTAEYIRFNLRGSINVATPTFATGAELHDLATFSGDIFRTGINYKFDANEERFDASTRSFVTAPRFDSLQAEFGSRYWYSTGSTAKNLSGLTPDLVSRLTYSGLDAHSGEIFGRVDHRSGMFVKGFAGTGRITSGNLKDEDFPPGISPYSATNSAQKEGTLTYFSADVGYNLYRTQNFRVGPFAGFHYDNEIMNARGCTQVATNPNVCVPNINDNIAGITEDAAWKSVRLGASAEMLWDRLKVSVEGAWLPSTRLVATDTHWLRIQPLPGNFTGPVPADGNGTGMQFEGVVSYLINDAFSIGVGGRYWRMETTEGNSHFEGNIVGGGGSPQAVTYVTERYGGFVQAAYRF